MSHFSRTQSTALTVAVPEPNLAIIPEQEAPSGLSVAQISAILLAYWKQILLIAFAFIVLGAVVIKILPKTYTAMATLIVNSDLKDPLAGRDFPAEMINSYVSTQIELMTSPIVLGPVVDKLNLMQDKDFTADFSGNADSLREFVQRNLAAAILVERGTGGQLIYVSASAKSAVQAAQIANAVAGVYIEMDRRRLSDPAGERAQRYSEELAELREKASIAQDKLSAFRKENGIGDDASEVTVLNKLHESLLEAQRLRVSLEATRAGREITSQIVPGSAALDAQLEQLVHLRSTYGPQHPKMKEINAQIAMTQQSLANANHAVELKTDADLARAKDEERKYMQAIADQEAKVLKLRQAQDAGSKLELELESAKSVYKQALGGFDQIMFQAVASHTNVSVVSRATPPLRASKPNKMKLMLVVLVAGLALGVGLPFGYGLFVARRLRCRDDLERDFGIAVLAQLEPVPTLAVST